MAAQDFDATTAPVNIVAALSLASGRYTIQNVSTVASLFVRSASTAPAATARGFRLESGGHGMISGDEATYVWTDDLAGCPAIVDEIP